MTITWLDILFLIILIIALIVGIIKGLVRQIIGILAVIIGLILSLAFYPYVASVFAQLIKNEAMSGFLGFATIFVLVLLLGWIIGRLFSKAMKGPLKFLNQFLGGCFGFLKGVLLCGILVFALLVFPVNTQALKSSFLAPYCVWITRGIINIIPEDVKNTFLEAYKEIFGDRGKDVKRV